MASKRRFSATVTIAALLLLWGVTTSVGAAAGTKPLFDYYVLSLHWLPTLCQDDPAADECSGARRNAFVVDGLWPHKDYASPVRCDVHQDLSDSLVQRMSDLLPTRRLVEREWLEHGTCTGLAPEQYFELVRKAYESIALPQSLYQGAGPQRTFYDVIKAFTHLDHGLFPQAVSVTCTAESPARLKDVRICLSDKYLGSNYCSGDVIASGCRTLNIVIPTMQ